MKKSGVGTAMKSTRACSGESGISLLGGEAAHLAPMKCGCG